MNTTDGHQPENPGFLLGPGDTVRIEVDETEPDRKLPAWVLADDGTPEKVWQVYRQWTAGERAPDLARQFGINVRTVYNWIDKARAEIPHVAVAAATDLVGRREEMVRDVRRIMQVVADSTDIPALVKVDLTTKLLKEVNPYLTAIEEILGFRKGSGGKVSIEQKGDHAQAVVFNFDTWLKENG